MKALWKEEIVTVTTAIKNGKVRIVGKRGPQWVRPGELSKCK